MELKHALEKLRIFIGSLKKQAEDNPPAAFFDKILNTKSFFSEEGLGSVLLSEKEGREYRNLVRDIVHAVARQFGCAKRPDELHVSEQAIESAIQSTILRALGSCRFAAFIEITMLRSERMGRALRFRRKSRKGCSLQCQHTKNQ
jgi:hypothetical protein